MSASLGGSHTCARCFEARAARNSQYCAPCAKIVEREATRQRCTRDTARRRARKLDAHAITDALEAFGCWAGAALPVIHNGYDPATIGARCIATQNGREWFAGIICAWDEDGAWIYLPDASGREGAGRELRVPVLKVPSRRVKVVEG